MRTQTHPPAPHEPVAVELRYPPAGRGVDRDRDKSWWRRLLPVVLQHRAIVGIALTAAVLQALVQIAIPRVVGLAIDEAILPLAPRFARVGAEPARSLTFYATLLGALAVGRFVLMFGYRYYLQRMAFAIEYDLRTLLFDHFNRLTFSFFDRVQTGQLISRANSDIRTVERFLAFAPMMSVTAISFFVAFGIMARIHLGLALVSLAPLPFVYLTGKAMRVRMFPISWVVQARTADVASIVEENATGVRVVKAFAAERQEIGKLAKAAQRLRWAAVKQVDIRAIYGPVMENIPRIGQALILLYGGWLVIQGTFSVGNLVTFNFYVILLQAPFRMLGFLMMMSHRAAASGERILELLDEEPEIVDRPGAVDLVDPRGAVEFRRVRFAYPDGAPVLDGFDLQISPGETVAIVGRTGSGKSTLPRLLLRAYDVDEGAVLIDGHDVRDVTVRSLRAHVGLVPDEPFLFSEPVRDNIAYARPNASRAEVEAAARIAGAHEFICELERGYDTVVGERGYTLSGGQRQRIAIARTVLANPPVLILDDATSSIDVQVEQRIHEALKTLMTGRTTIIIAHRLSTIALADRVVLVEGGRVYADGTHEELLRTVPLYAEVLARAEEEELHPPESRDRPFEADDDEPPLFEELGAES